MNDPDYGMNRAGPQPRETSIDGLDPGIAMYVEVLNANGIETYESCQGGPGHSFAEPTVRFHGGQSEGFRAFAVAHNHGFPVAEIRRFWSAVDGEPTGPHWEMTFSALADGTPAHHLLELPGFADGARRVEHEWYRHTERSRDRKAAER